MPYAIKGQRDSHFGPIEFQEDAPESYGFNLALDLAKRTAETTGYPCQVIDHEEGDEVVASIL